MPTLRPKRIEASWLSYREEVLPANASSVQLQESRRAFYAGARGLLTEIMVGLTPGSEAEEPDLTMMEGIEAELQAFVDNVKRGLA